MRLRRYRVNAVLIVEQALLAGVLISSVNFSETLAELAERSIPLPEAQWLLQSLPLNVDTMKVTREDFEKAAVLPANLLPQIRLYSQSVGVAGYHR
jgi:hypothetical protein